MNSKANHIISEKLKREKLVAFDVGAMGGVFSLPRLSDYTRFWGFEPNSIEVDKLLHHSSHSNTRYFPFALSERGGLQKIHLTKYPSYSSFLEFDDLNFRKHFHMMKGYQIWKEGMQVEKILTVPSKTLDQLIREENVSFIDFIKLDTQGTELEILRGGQQALDSKKIGVIFCEVSFVRSYRGQNLFADLDIFMRENGHEFIDCRFYPDTSYEISLPFSKKIHDRPRYALGGDAVFVPNLDLAIPGDSNAFKIGIVLASLGYLGIAYNFFIRGGLSKKEIQVLLHYFDDLKIKIILKNWTPPAVYYLAKKYFSRFI